MARVLEAWFRLYTSIAIWATFVMMLLICGDALGRYLFNRPIRGAVEIIADFFMVALVYLGATHGYREQALVRITVLVRLLPNRLRLLVNYFSQLFTVGILGLLLYATARQTWRVYLSARTSPSAMGYDLWPPNLLVPLGILLLLLFSLMDISKVPTGASSLLVGDEDTADEVGF